MATVHGVYCVDVCNNYFAKEFIYEKYLYMNIKASINAKISTFLEKNGGMRLWIWTLNEFRKRF